jgi:DNA-binding NtrC family response regulator
LNSEQALACIDAGVHPDILICDYRLVGGNGVETVRRVRDVAGREIPSVILTGDTTFRKIGADELSNCSVLHKPVDTERLVSLVWSLSCPRTCGS